MRALVAFGLAVAALAPRAAGAQCRIPGFTEAAFGDHGVTLTGNACTDSYDSSVAPGTYAGTRCSPPGVPCAGGVGTNATGAGAITLSGNNACVKGACQIGYGGSTSDISGASKCTVAAVEPAPIELPPVTLPSLPNGSPYDVSSPATLAPNRRYGAIRGSGNAGNVITLSAGAYELSSLQLSGQSSLRITSGPVYVYLSGPGSALDLSGNGINNTTGVATNLVFMCTDSVTSASITGNGTTAFGLYCPRADVTVTGNGDVYGAIVGKTVRMVGNGTIHYDEALGDVTSSQIECSSVETSRASPVIASLTPAYGGPARDVVVQGTFEAPTGTPSTIDATADIASWSFPYIKGHLRARLVSSIATTPSAFRATTCTASGVPGGCSVLFDAGAAGHIPPIGTFAGAGCATPSGACRHVFTNTNEQSPTGTTTRPATSVFSANDSSAIGPLIAPSSAIPGITRAHQQAIMQKVLRGRLGGVDRSTVAVIGPSALAGSGTRPTMAYFGATDGMLHAVCASEVAAGPCAGRVGTELWAFLPRVQLPLLRANRARIDGSPHVLDAFGDFDGDGRSRWATILVLQTGFGLDATPAVYALDVTDPTSPRVLWETTAPLSPPATALGTGLSVASGRIGTNPTSVAVVVTNNGGTGGPGVVATALSLDTGEPRWQFGWRYPSAPRDATADGPLPVTAIPGGAVGVDLTGAKRTTDFVFGDIYGNLWRLDATTGVSRNGPVSPLFSFSTNKHPIGVTPAIYASGGEQFAVFASGGYADHSGSAAWRSTAQYVIAARLSSTSPTIDETAEACSTCDLAFALATADQYGFAQALVVGTQLFLTTDSTDVNASTFGVAPNTGSLRTVDLATQSSRTTVIHVGASSLAAHRETLISSGGQTQQQAAAAAGGAGPPVDVRLTASLQRLLWLGIE